MVLSCARLDSFKTALVMSDCKQFSKDCTSDGFSDTERGSRCMLLQEGLSHLVYQHEAPQVACLLQRLISFCMQPFPLQLLWHSPDRTQRGRCEVVLYGSEVIQECNGWDAVLLGLPVNRILLSRNSQVAGHCTAPVSRES